MARKWWGYPLDGVIGSSELVDPDSTVDNSPGEGETGPPGLDFWREMQFETGVFGYFGRNEAAVTTDDHVDLLLQGNGLFQLQTPMMVSRPDRFERVGFDARLQVQDLEIFGAFVWGWNDDPISDENPAAIESHKLFTWFFEADDYFKPWLIGYCRYEELSYDNNDRQSEVGIKTDFPTAVPPPWIALNR